MHTSLSTENNIIDILLRFISLLSLNHIFFNTYINRKPATAQLAQYYAYFYFAIQMLVAPAGDYVYKITKIKTIAASHTFITYFGRHYAASITMHITYVISINGTAFSHGATPQR